MTASLVEKIADAVLYEGYLLYPYRHTSLKNRFRWTFGVVPPRSDGQPSDTPEHNFMQTEGLLRGSEKTAIEVKVRFLQVIARRVGDFCGQPGDACEASLTDMTLFREV